jgi:hypothetical protein
MQTVLHKVVGGALVGRPASGAVEGGASSQSEERGGGVHQDSAREELYSHA